MMTWTPRIRQLRRLCRWSKWCILLLLSLSVLVMVCESFGVL